MKHESNFNINRFALIFTLVVFLAFAGSTVSAIDQSYENFKVTSSLLDAKISDVGLNGGLSTSELSYTRPPTTNDDALKASSKFAYKPKPYVFTPIVSHVTQDPIIGTWRYYYASSNNPDWVGYDSRYQFNADGTYSGSLYVPKDKETYVFSGVWSANGDNSYTLTDTRFGTSHITPGPISVASYTVKYDLFNNVIYDTRYPNIIHSPYQGSVTTVPGQISTPTPTVTPIKTPTYTYKTPTYTYKPRTYTYTPTPVAPVQDPIIGGWRMTGDYGYDDRYRFYADGTWEESYYFFQLPGMAYQPGITGTTARFTGTWTPNGGNSYTLRVSSTGTTWTMIYDPARNCIYDPRFPSLLKKPYTGDIVKGSISSVGKPAVSGLSGLEMEKIQLALNNQFGGIVTT
ncbi:MAG: hypothetical protein WCJ93_11720 [Methanomicrobiales archaeon]